MATFTSYASGNFNAWQTWFASDPAGSGEGSDYPGPNDLVTIGTGHTIDVNGSYPSTGGFGTGSITGTLRFATGATSSITVKDGVNWTFNSGGKLEMKPTSAYTASLLHQNTGDGTYGFVFSSGSIIDILGDTAYYGNDLENSLASNFVTADGHCHTTDDMSAIWPTGTELIIHKNSGTAASTIADDFARLTISSYTGAVINVTETDVTATTTYATGGVILNASRNVIIGKASATLTKGTYNASAGPKLNIATDIANVSVIAASFQGIRSTSANNSGIFTKCVFRNSNYLPSGSTLAYYNDCIFFSNSSNFYNAMAICNNCYIICCSVSTSQQASIMFKNSFIFGNNRGPYVSYVRLINSYVYGNYTSDLSITYADIINSKMGISNSGVNYNAVLATDYLTNTNNTEFTTGTVTRSSRIDFISYGNNDHYDLGVDDYRTYQLYGSTVSSTTFGSGGNPNQRSGGNDRVIVVTPGSSVTAYKYVIGMNSFDYLESGTYTAKIYCWHNYAQDLTSSHIKLFAYYYDGTGPITITEASSSSTLAQCGTAGSDLDAWDDLSVTFTHDTDGIVKYWIEVYLYASTKYIWIDPLVVYS